MDSEENFQQKNAPDPQNVPPPEAPMLLVTVQAKHMIVIIANIRLINDCSTDFKQSSIDE